MSIKVKLHGWKLKWFRYSEKLVFKMPINRGYIDKKRMPGI